MSLILRAGLLCASGVALGLLANGFTPRPAPLGQGVLASAEQPGAACEDAQASVARISVREAKPLCLACAAAFVDARSPQEYAAGHVTGALHLSPGEGAETILPRLRAAPTVIVYDRDRDCAAADRVATRLQAGGIRDVRVLTGAWPEWLAGGGPGESGTCSLCTAGTR
ncbi:MAG TPA: rhodanese-like domain-containing protein [Myxococcales bacterium]|nr:rhodanese-like domain-containing protein [Myxococcales bacterium]